MKYLKYDLLQSVLDDGTLVLIKKTMGWSKANEEIAKNESHNGNYTILDDGVEAIVEATQLDRIEAQIAYTAMMTDTLLEV